MQYQVLMTGRAGVVQTVRAPVCRILWHVFKSHQCLEKKSKWIKNAVLAMKRSLGVTPEENLRIAQVTN